MWILADDLKPRRSFVVKVMVSVVIGGVWASSVSSVPE